jgi:hypothetical protein
MKRPLLALALAACALPPLYGADIYRWVDDQGRMHLSEQVPKRFKPFATPLPKGTDCASLRLRFQESAECYAPFVNTNGSVKPEAFRVCGPPVPEPVRECSSTPAH